MRFWVIPYLMSIPASPLPSSTIAGLAALSVIRLVMAYGLTSIARLAGGGSRPTSEPAAEILNIPLAPLSPPAEIGSRVR